MLSFKDFLAEAEKNNKGRNKSKKQFNPIADMDFESDNIDSDEVDGTRPDPLDNRVVG